MFGMIVATTEINKEKGSSWKCWDGYVVSGCICYTKCFWFASGWDGNVVSGCKCC
jgi:hypothetical protein